MLIRKAPDTSGAFSRFTLIARATRALQSIPRPSDPLFRRDRVPQIEYQHARVVYLAVVEPHRRIQISREDLEAQAGWHASTLSRIAVPSVISTARPTGRRVRGRRDGRGDLSCCGQYSLVRDTPLHQEKASEANRRSAG